MKTLILLAILCMSTGAFAQQPPDLRSSQPPANQQETVPPEEPLYGEKLTELLQAQTAAIKALIQKVAELEIRMKRLEEKQP